MARPLRIEFAGAVYHVMAHGNQDRLISADDQDRKRLYSSQPRPLRPGRD